MFGSTVGGRNIQLEDFMRIFIHIYRYPGFISGSGIHVVP
jgi:hypothetical protein